MDKCISKGYDIVEFSKLFGLQIRKSVADSKAIPHTKESFEKAVIDLNVKRLCDSIGLIGKMSGKGNKYLDKWGFYLPFSNKGC